MRRNYTRMAGGQRRSGLHGKPFMGVQALLVPSCPPYGNCGFGSTGRFGLTRSSVHDHAVWKVQRLQCSSATDGSPTAAPRGRRLRR